MASAQKGCITRLQKEYKSLLRGAKGTDFEGGWYHGKLVFPPNYPFKPPSISIFTPNGRFAVNTKLCLSITDYHPESWNPMWSVGTILTGLLSFMYDSQPTTGSITTSKAEKHRLAKDSLVFNAKNATFRKLFPQLLEEYNRRLASQQQQQQQQQACKGVNGSLAAADQASGQVEQQQQQQAQQAAGAAMAGAAGGPPGSNLLTVALVMLVLAIAAVPLLSSGANFNLGSLARLRSFGAGS